MSTRNRTPVERRQREATTLLNSGASRLVAAGALIVAALFLPGAAAQAHDPAFTFRAYGSAIVDGVQAPGEWDRAGKWEFPANRPAGEGGGTIPATLYVQNDATTLYLALKVTRPTLGSSSVAFGFDNDHDGTLLEEGDDSILLNPSGGAGFYDEFVTRQPPCPGGAVCLGIPDAQVGGTSDGLGAATNNGTFTFYELSHPLDTPDDAHDFSLRFGKRVGFNMSLRFCGPTCADTDSPQYGDIVITSLSAVPPDTQLLEGPREDLPTNVVPSAFRFTGSDDVVAAEDLTFQCQVDGNGFAPCASPVTLALADGRHTMDVRAVDEVQNFDASPASRTWTVDTTAPRRPTVSGPLRVRRARATYRLRASDAIDAPAQLRFRCALDRRSFKACGNRVTVSLSPGAHVLRVVSLDRAGNRSVVAALRILRLKQKRHR